MLSKENGTVTCSILSGVRVYLDFSRRISYRFRLISISCDPNFIFSIDNHTMTVIEVDGTNVQPLLIDSLKIFAGARGLIQVSCSANRY
jgi:FtsP/CotA-like multicopper oxidase with cupredoxin domain